MFPFTPLLPDRFTDYLEKIYFKSFTPGNFGEKVSRHSVAHGVADEKSFDKKSSMIAFLIIDQLYYYLGANYKLTRIKLI